MFPAFPSKTKKLVMARFWHSNGQRSENRDERLTNDRKIFTLPVHRTTEPGIGKEEALMKRIEAIIRPTRVGKVCAAIENAGHPGVRFSLIESRERQGGEKYQLRGRTYKADLVTRAKVEVITKDAEVDRIVSAIREAALTGATGDGEIYIHSMEDAIRIGPGEKKEEAARACLSSTGGLESNT
jgi:nitrogen regulatory protein P-II 1